MKNITTIILLGFSISLSYAQCNCDEIMSPDGKVVMQCNPLPISNNNSAQVTLALASNGKDIFVNISVRFSSSPKKIVGELSVRQQDNNIITLGLVNSQVTNMVNSQLASAIFIVPGSELSKMKMSPIKTISIRLSDGLIRTYKAKMNEDVLIAQLECLE